MSENNLSVDSTGYPVPYGKEPCSAEPVYSWAQYEKPSALNHYLEILSRRKWAVLLFLAAAFGVMTAVSLMTPWTYKGVASVEVIASAPNVTTFARIMNDSSPSEELTRTQAAIFKNRGLAARVIKKLKMDKNPAFNPYLAKKKQGIVQRIKDLLAGGINGLFYEKLPPSMVRLEQREALLGAFNRDLEVERTLGTNIITVAFSSTDRFLAKEATNSTVDELMRWQIDRNVDAAGLAKAQLAKQIETAHGRLEKSQAQLDNYARRWGIVSIKSDSNLILRQLDTINAALEKVEANRIAKSAYYRSAQKSNLDSLPAVLQSRLIEQLENEYTRLMGRYEELRAIYKDKYAGMQKLKAQIAYTGNRIRQEEKRILSSLRDDYNSSTKIAQALAVKAKENQALALDFNNRIQTYKTLVSQVDTNRKVYVSLLKRSEEIDANVGTELGNVKVLSLSPLPVIPYKPNLFLNFLIALVLGTTGGLGMAFILENSDIALRSPGDLPPCHSTRILGVLPLMGRAKKKGLAAKVVSEPDTIFSEAIRFTGALIELASPTGTRVKSIFITSTDESAGKSTVAANLALAYASSGQARVVLVDADLSRGHLHDFLGQNGGRRPLGLSDYLGGRCRLDAILCGTGLPNLSLIPSGRGAEGAGHRVRSEQIKELLRALSPRFDWIIMDGQPLGSDTLAVAKTVDAVILIAAIGRTHRKSLQIFEESMSNVGANVLGVIVNKLRAGRCSFDCYSRYYRSSGRKTRGGSDPAHR